MASPIEQLCSACLCLSCCTFLVLIVFSWGSLEFNEIGLDYSSITKRVDSQTYVNGLHFLGIGHSFFKFPKTVQTMEFSNQYQNNNLQQESFGESLVSRTLDGLEVDLEISFQYRLMPDKLYTLYKSFGMKYQQVYREQAQHIITEMATKYTAYNFFKDRQRIGIEMELKLNDMFVKKCYASIEFFQLRNVDLPDKFENAISLTEVHKQDIHKAQAENQKMVIELQTQQKVAELQKNVTINLAEGDALKIYQDNQAKVNAFKLQQTIQAKTYGKLKKDLGLSNQELLNYIKAKLIRDQNSKKLIISLENLEDKKPDL